MVGREHHEGVIGQSRFIEAVKDGADALVQRASAGLERRHVGAGRRRVWQLGRGGS